MADPADVRLHVPAALIGDPARAAMLLELLGAGRRSVGDLARVAGVAPSTASAHVRALADAGLVRTDRAGRQRLVRLAGADVARALEALLVIAPARAPRSLRGHRVAADLVAGRTCYDHLAGDLGLRVTDLLVRVGVAPSLTPGGTAGAPRSWPPHPVVTAWRLRALDPTARRPFTRGCQDWTGGRPHLAGRLGRQVLDVLTGEGWLEPRPGSRAVRLTGRGERGLADLEAS